MHTPLRPFKTGWRSVIGPVSLPTGRLMRIDVIESDRISRRGARNRAPLTQTI